MTLVEGNPKAHFSIVTIPRFRGGRYSFPWTDPPYPYLIMLSVKQGDIKYHYLSLWYHSTWDWTLVFRVVGEPSTTKPMGRSLPLVTGNHFQSLWIREIRLCVVICFCFSFVFSLLEQLVFSWFISSALLQFDFLFYININFLCKTHYFSRSFNPEFKDTCYTQERNVNFFHCIQDGMTKSKLNGPN